MSSFVPVASNAPSLSGSIDSDNHPPDDIGDLLNQLTIAPSSVPSLDAPSSLSGEYLLSRKGVAGAATATGSGKLVRIVCLRPSQVSSLCFGLIGQRKLAFCLKSKADCPSYCSGGAHYSSRFTPQVDNYYIYKTASEDSAWCNFSIERKKLLARDDSMDYDPSESLSLNAWKALFESFRNATTDVTDEEIKSSIGFMSKPPVLAELKTPARRQKNQKLLKFELKLGQEQEEEGGILTKENSGNKNGLSASRKQPIEDLKFWNKKNDFSDLPELVSRIEYVLLALDEDLDEVQDNILRTEEVASDLMALSAGLTGISSNVGVDTQANHPDLWSAVEDFDSRLDGIDLSDVQDSVIKANVSITELKEELIQNKKHWMTLGRKWLPLIQSHESSIKLLKSITENNALPARQSTDTQNIDLILEGHSNSVNPNHNSRSPDDKDILIQNLQESMTNLEARLSNQESRINEYQQAAESYRSNPTSGLGFKGVTYKQFYFANPFEIQTWMKSNMSQPSHGLFVDLNSFCEFFGGDRYIEMKSTLNDLYMSTKIGHSTIADSVVAASFQNILPGAYARVSSIGKSTSDAEIVSQPELPGLPTFQKWDARDGRNGRRFWMRDETRKTEKQLDGWIRNQLEGPAQLLAKDLLVDSYAMSEALYTFISTSYDDTMHSGKFDSNQAWALTSSFVKRIFTELSYVRVVARDGIHVNDPWSTAATFLFATLKAHSIMEEFMRLSIKDHPSISSEMVKFVCYSQPASDASALESRVTAVEALQRSDQSTLSKMEPRVKRLETWKAEADKWIKKLREKTGL